MERNIGKKDKQIRLLFVLVVSIGFLALALIK